MMMSESHLQPFFPLVLSPGVLIGDSWSLGLLTEADLDLTESGDSEFCDCCLDPCAPDPILALLELSNDQA